MISFIDELISLEREISNVKGDFSLFTLFLRDGSENKWDLIISAPWIGKKKKETLDYIVNKIKPRLDEQELISISRIVIVDEKNPALEAFHRAINVEHGNIEVKDSSFFGLQINHAYIITSKRIN